jgi:hypothetical protein
MVVVAQVASLMRYLKNRRVTLLLALGLELAQFITLLIWPCYKQQPRYSWVRPS